MNIGWNVCFVIIQISILITLTRHYKQGKSTVRRRKINIPREQKIQTNFLRNLELLTRIINIRFQNKASREEKREAKFLYYHEQERQI